jgi:hypothetical protein
VHGFQSLRQIALVIECLKDRLQRHVDALQEARKSRATNKPTRRTSNLGDDALAALLNEAQPKDGRNFMLSGPLINKIRRGQYEFRGNQKTRLTDALQTVCKNESIDLDLSRPLPRWVEEDYAKELPEIFSIPGWLPLLQGVPLGSLSDVLPGLWQFMYYSPKNRAGQREAEIRGFAVLFEGADERANTINLVVLSGHTRWKGHAFANETHLYIMCTDVTRIETAFLVTNRPSRVDHFVAGVAAALERRRSDERKPRTVPVEGVVCFGQKWAAGERATPAMANIARKMQRGEELDAQDEANITGTLCIPYDEDKLQHVYPALHRYICSVEINGNPGLPDKPSLFVAYP